MGSNKNENSIPARSPKHNPKHRETFEINRNRRTNTDGKAETSIRIPKENDDKPKR